MNTNSAAIGVFDSGVGGLSIAKSIRFLLPNEDIIYYADNKFNPYGERSADFIYERSRTIVEFFLNQGCKLIVVACNTATVNTIAKLRHLYDVPIVGVEPGLKPAAINSKVNSVGVLATEATINSDAYRNLVSNYGQNAKVYSQSCPKFVQLVEEVSLSGSAVQSVIEEYISPLLAKGCDQLVLGCTHFSFLTDAIRKFAGNDIEIVDTAIPVAREVKRRLDSFALLSNQPEHGRAYFYSSDLTNIDVDKVNLLWGQQELELLIL